MIVNKEGLALQTEPKTQILAVNDLRRDRQHLVAAAEVLRHGGLVVFATETVYGIGANALDGAAVSGIFRAKGRPQDNPLIVHISHIKELDALVSEVPAAARRLADAFWPGPLTMILPKSDAIPAEVSAGLATVAVRMPSHLVARALISLAGVPVAAPSANLSGSPSPTTAGHCIDDLNGRVDMILDSGSCTVGLESTVITLAGEVPRLLRPGFITVEQLREVLGEVEVDDAVYREVKGGDPVASPGMKYRHYSPKATVCLVHGSFEDYLKLLYQKRGNGVWALAFDDDRARLAYPCVTYGKEGDAASQAGRLFAALRELDEHGARRVYARAPSAEGVGLAVYNRLSRAAGTKIFLEDGNWNE